MLDVASGPDLLRLVVIPFFAYVAWLDIRTRRVPNKTWYPLAIIALVALIWDFQRVVIGDVAAVDQQTFLIQVVISVGFVVPLAYLFWRIGGFGGADAKAFMVIALLLPAFPSYQLWRIGLDAPTLGPVLNWLPGATYNGVLPMERTALGVFSVTVLSNTVVMGALYPFGLAVRNAAIGYVSGRMFVAKPVRSERITDEYGTLLQRSGGGLSGVLSFRGLDLDALRMYLRWRGLTLSELRANPERYRNPATLPDERNLPGDGAIPVDGWNHDEVMANVNNTTEPVGMGADTELWNPETHVPETVDNLSVANPADDPWGATTFLDEIDGTAYGTSPEDLREGLETLASDDVVWISPGIPFLVPLFVGLVFAFIYGDVLFAMFQAIGLGPN